MSIVMPFLVTQLVTRTIIYEVFGIPMFPWQVQIVGPSPCPEFQDWASKNLGHDWGDNVEWNHTLYFGNPDFGGMKDLAGSVSLLWDPTDPKPTHFHLTVNISDKLNCEEAKATAIKEVLGTKHTLEWWIANQDYISIDNPEWLYLMDGLGLNNAMHMYKEEGMLDATKHFEGIFFPWDAQQNPDCQILKGIKVAAENDFAILHRGSIQNTYDKYCSP